MLGTLRSALASAAASLALFGLGAGSAEAAYIGISSVGGQLQVSWGQLSFMIDGVSQSSSNSAFIGDDSFTFEGRWNFDPTLPGTGDVPETTLYFATADGWITDILTYSIDDDDRNRSTITGTFTSGLGQSLGMLPEGATVGVAGPWSFSHANLQGSVTTGELPEPDSLPLAALALGVGGWAWRRGSRRAEGRAGGPA